MKEKKPALTLRQELEHLIALVDLLGCDNVPVESLDHLTQLLTQRKAELEALVCVLVSPEIASFFFQVDTIALRRSSDASAIFSWNCLESLVFNRNLFLSKLTWEIKCNTI